MFKSNKLMAVLICLMGVRVTLGFAFGAFAKNSEGEMTQMGYLNYDDFDSLDENDFLKLAWGWDSEEYEIRFTFNPFEINTQTEGEEDFQSLTVGDGEAAGTLGRLDIKCISVNFQEIGDNNLAILTTSLKAEGNDLRNNYEPKPEHKGDFADGSTDIYMMMSKANAWMAENCVSDGDKIVSVETWGGKSLTIKFGFTIRVMSASEIQALEADINTEKEASEDFEVIGVQYVTRRRRLALV